MTGRSVCPRCDLMVALRNDGEPRKHKNPDGGECKEVVAPESNFPAIRKNLPKFRI